MSRPNGLAFMDTQQESMHLDVVHAGMQPQARRPGIPCLAHGNMSSAPGIARDRQGRPMRRGRSLGDTDLSGTSLSFFISDRAAAQEAIVDEYILAACPSLFAAMISTRKSSNSVVAGRIQVNIYTLTISAQNVGQVGYCALGHRPRTFASLCSILYYRCACGRQWQCSPEEECE